MNKSNIVVLTDLTSQSLPAIKSGFEWAKRLGCGVALIHIHKGNQAEKLVSIFPEFENRLNELTKTFSDTLSEKLNSQLNKFINHQVPVSSKILYSNSLDEYIKLVENLKTKLLVVPVVESEFDSLWNGSLVEQLIRGCKVPVLITKKEVLNLKTITVPFAFQGLSEKALSFSGDISEAFGCQIDGVHVVKNMTSEQRATSLNDLETLSTSSKDVAAINSVKLKLQELEGKGLLRSIELIDGESDAKEALLERLNSKQTDFILMGSSGKNGFERLYLGSFCEYILRNSKSSLLIVK